jgi:hypothetical protein
MAKRKDTDFKPIFTRDTCQENKKKLAFTLLFYLSYRNVMKCYCLFNNHGFQTVSVFFQDELFVNKT